MAVLVGGESQVTIPSPHRGAAVVEISFVVVPFEKENVEDHLELVNQPLEAGAQDET